MIRFLLLAMIAAAIASHPAVAASTEPKVHKVIVKKTVAKDGTTRTETISDPAARALIADCGERKFETQAEVVDATGRKRLTKIKLCAKPGEDPAKWLTSLRSAQTTIKGTTSLPQATRTEIVAALQTEIAKMEAAAAGTSAPAISATPK